MKPIRGNEAFHGEIKYITGEMKLITRTWSLSRGNKVYHGEMKLITRTWSLSRENEAYHGEMKFITDKWALNCWQYILTLQKHAAVVFVCWFFGDHLFHLNLESWDRNRHNRWWVSTIPGRNTERWDEGFGFKLDRVCVYVGLGVGEGVCVCVCVGVWEGICVCVMWEEGWGSGWSRWIE